MTLRITLFSAIFLGAATLPAKAEPVLEIVTFSLAPQVSDAAFLATAQRTEPLLQAMTGFRSR